MAAPGTVCWMDLATPDPEASSAFYAELFGWEAEGQHLAGGAFTRFRLGGHDVASLYQLDETQLERGTPAHWTAYVAVTDAEASAGRAVELGGSVAVTPFAVGDLGRMAVVLDPAAAWLAVWEARTFAGAGLLGTAGSLGWAGLLTPAHHEGAPLTEYYTALLGWTAGATTGPGSAFRLADDAGDSDALVAVWHDTEGSWPGPSQWLVHIMVDDLDAAGARCQSLGGAVIAEAAADGPVGPGLIATDPQGALFALQLPPAA